MQDRMPGPIVYIDTSEIRDGKLEELKAATKELAAFVGSVAIYSPHAGFARTGNSRV